MKYYIQYPISVDCNLSCPYCFFTEEKNRSDLNAPDFSVHEYNIWRDTHLKDADEILLHFQGGEPTTDKNISDIVEFLSNTSIEKIDLLTNGLGSIDSYEKLLPYRHRFHRIGFTFHRKVIGHDSNLCQTFHDNVLLMKSLGFPVYVKELLFSEETDRIISSKLSWEKYDIPFKIQDFKGWDAGTDFTEYMNYTDEELALIDQEYLKSGNECYCVKGYKNIIIRSGWMSGDILACWKDLTVIGNIKDNTYNPNYKIMVDTSYPDGIDVIVDKKLYRGTYPRDSRKLEKLRLEGSYTSGEKRCMKLKNFLIFDSTFNESFNKLLSMEFDSEISMQLVKTLNVIEKQKMDIITTRDIIIKRYAVLNDDGGYKMENDKLVFVDDSKKQKLNDEINLLLNGEFEIPLNKKLSIVSGKITPLSIKSLIDAGIISI